MNDISIVIAHRGDPMGLWATISSCEASMALSGLNYEYCLCLNGQKPHPGDQELLRNLRVSGKLGFLYESEEAITPPTARQIATEGATGELLCFLDNHVVLGPKYFERVMFDFSQYDMDELHSATAYYPGGDTVYEYQLALDKNFWTDLTKTFPPENTTKPYRIAAGGHGGFVVPRKTWEEVGGYWRGFQGYAGEEMYFDLKMGQMNKSVWIDPKLVHYHYAGNRGYPRHYTDDYYRNLMMCARMIGGPEWMTKVYNHCSKGAKQRSAFSFFDLYMQAEEQSSEHAKELVAKRSMSLEQLLEHFRLNNISH